MNECEIDWEAAAACGSLAVAILALILPWRSKIIHRVGDRLGARNVHFYAWRMIDDILLRSIKGQLQSRPEEEFAAVEMGLNAIELSNLDPSHLIGCAIELRYAWNIAKNPKSVDLVTLISIRTRAAHAMEAFDQQVYVDGAVFDENHIALPYRWKRPIIAAWRWFTRSRSCPLNLPTEPFD